MAPRQALHQRLPKDMPTLKMQSSKHIEEESAKVKIQIINLQQLLSRMRDSVDAIVTLDGSPFHICRLIDPILTRYYYFKMNTAQARL